MHLLHADPTHSYLQHEVKTKHAPNNAHLTTQTRTCDPVHSVVVSVVVIQFLIMSLLKRFTIHYALIDDARRTSFVPIVTR